MRVFFIFIIMVIIEFKEVLYIVSEEVKFYFYCFLKSEKYIYFIIKLLYVWVYK